MRADIASILALDVPVIVRLGERQLTVTEARSLAPGSIIELPKAADDELELFINNKPIGSGHAVKIEENFGIRITYIGDPAERIDAIVGDLGFDENGDDDAELLAVQLLGGQ